MTTRRRLLGVLSVLGAVGMAGCLTTATVGEDAGGDPAPGDGESEVGDDLPGGDTDDSGQTRLRGTGGPGVTLAFSDAQPDLPLAVAVDVTRETATDDHPPGLRVSVTNTSDAAVGLGEGRAVVFAYRTSTDGTLTLLPAEFDAPAEPGCWRLTDGIAITEEYRTLRLEPGETVAQDLSLYAAYDESEADACLPVGEHRFESLFTVFDDPENLEEGARATWGFSVLLE